jgi:hypothetical protein
MSADLEAPPGEGPDDGTLPASANPPPTGAAPPPSAPPSPAITPRELLLAALAVSVAALITFALLTAGSLPASDATAAEVTTAQPSSLGPEEAPAVIRTWSAANRTMWVGNRRNAVAHDVEADDTIRIWMRTVRPALVVRCAGGSTEVFVFTQSAAKIEPRTDDHTVTLSLDGAEAVTELWPDSDDHDALFAPDGAAFARRLAAARTLGFGFTPHNAPPATVTFQVAGLDRALATAARECGWKQ